MLVVSKNYFRFPRSTFGLQQWLDVDDDDVELKLLRELVKKRVTSHLKRKKKRRRKKGSSLKFYVIDLETGKPRRGTYLDSLWWLNYVVLKDTHLTKPMKDRFRNRFRIPFHCWEDLVDDMKSNDLFRQWHDGTKSAHGRYSSPLELLSLGGLRYLGRNCTFDDLEEHTFISLSTHYRFFEKFIEYGSTTLYEKYVTSPADKEDFASVGHEYNQAGFHGAIGSMDATHVTINGCRYGARRSHLGHKLNKTARSYNIVVNHRRRILSSTMGHPSTWNDKTIVLHDDFITKIKSGEIGNDKVFYLLRKDKDGNISRVKYIGVWVIVDGGYLNWSVTVPPFQWCDFQSQLRWSQWLESLRKDVECTFGIMKKRFRCLSHGIDALSVEKADKIWRTCCAIHNMLLIEDGYDDLWEEGELPSTESNAFSIMRLFEHNGESEVHCGDEVSTTFNMDEVPISEEVVRIEEMELDDFRQRLVEHFHILFTRRGIVWPRNSKPPRSV